MNSYDLEERLIDFSVLIIDIVNEMPNSKAGSHLSHQLVRSGTSVSLNYGEAQSGESRKDFIHKMKTESKMEKAMKENNELISIFVRSVDTAQSNMNKR